MCDGLKDILYKPVKQDSRNMAKLGNALGWDWLEQEGKKNVENPGRAVGKAAANAALWWTGNSLWGEGASAAGTAANAGTQAAAQAAQSAFPAALSSMPISEIAQLATQSPALQEGLMQYAQAAAPEVAKNVTKSSLEMGSKGLLDYGKEAFGAAKGFFNTAPARMGEGFNTLLDGSVPAGLEGSMESALMDTGYTPSSLKFAFQNSGDTINAAGEAGVNRPLSQNLLNYGKQGLRKGLANYSGGTGNKFADEMAQKMGMGMMSPQQPQQPMPQPRPFQQGPMEPLPNPYGGLLNSMDGPPPGMTREEWEKLKRMKMGRM